VFLGAVLSFAAQQDRAEPQQFPPIKVEVQLVSLTATVEDNQGHAVAGLQKQDFEVYEDGVLQDVAVFHNDERIPVSIGVIFDTSGSMVDKIDEVQDAVIHFIDTTNPEDDIFLVRFSTHVFLVEDFTGDRQRLRRAIGRLGPGGSTALYEAVVTGLGHLQEGKYKKKALLVITDGNDTSSQITLTEAVATAQQSEAIVYALGIGHGEHGSFGHLEGMFKDNVDVDALKAPTEVTGGRTFVLEGAHRKGGVDLIDQACQRVGAELRGQYTIGYYPKSNKEGTYRRIRIKAKDLRYTVRTREGYFSSKHGGAAQSQN
jgi:Ca-activated chloride channel family protein